MKATLSNEGDVTIIEISGYLDFGSAIPLKQSIEKLYKTNQHIKLVIDLRALEFVGSTGVSTFVKGLSSFNKMKIKPQYFGVKSEFQKLFKTFDDGQPFDVMDSKENALNAALERYHQWQIANPKSTHTH
jgi:anti-sigma B factor antagonist